MVDGANVSLARWRTIAMRGAFASRCHSRGRKNKTDLCIQLVLLGIPGKRPGPDTGLIPPITLPWERKTKMIAIKRKVLADGRISHMELGSCTGKLPFPQT